MKVFGPGNEESKSKDEERIPNSRIMKYGSNTVVVTFTPDHNQRRQILGASGQKEGQQRNDFIVEYDVDENVNYGEELRSAVPMIYPRHQHNSFFGKYYMFAIIDSSLYTPSLLLILRIREHGSQ